MIDIYNVVEVQNYDRKIKIDGVEYSCFSPSTFKDIRQNNICTIFGEVKNNNKKKNIAKIKHNEITTDIVNLKEYNRLFYYEAGYVMIGQNEYVALLKSRIPFLLLILLAISAIMSFAVLFSHPSTPTPTNPTESIPPVETSQQKMPEQTTSPRSDIPEGGGHMVLEYSLNATYDISNNEVLLNFKNPLDSSHDLSIDVCVIHDGVEYLIASSNRIQPGYKINSLNYAAKPGLLQANSRYDAIFKLYYYDSATGEKMIIDSVIKNVILTTKD